MELQVIDGLALFCNGKMIDFLAWGRDEIGPNGDLYVQAVENKMWTNTNDFMRPEYRRMVDRSLSQK